MHQTKIYRSNKITDNESHKNHKSNDDNYFDNPSKIVQIYI